MAEHLRMHMYPFRNLIGIIDSSCASALCDTKQALLFNARRLLTALAHF